MYETGAYDTGGGKANRKSSNIRKWSLGQRGVGEVGYSAR